MLRLLEIFFFFYLGYIFLKNVLGFFRPRQQQQGGYNQASQQQPPRRSGEIHVDHVPDSKPSSAPPHHPVDGNDSEYISFKEIKD